AAEETAEESAEAAAAAVAGVEQATEQQPKKRNRGLIAAIIAVLVIAAGVGGYFIYQGLPSTKLAKLRTQISAAIESQDVEGAIPLIEQAYEYAPDDPDLRRQYAECSEAILMKSFADGKLEEFIKGTDDLIKDYPEATEVLDPLVEASYKQLANDAVDSGSIPAMQAIKDRLADLHNAGRFNFAKEINWLEDNIQHVDLSNIFKTLAAKMIPLIKSNDRASVFETIRNELISGSGSAHKLCASSTQAEYHLPLISDPDASGKRLGIYYSGGHYFFYFGEYSGDDRQGNGVWICADNMRTSTSYREYWAEGIWSGDKPNGTFTLSNLSKYATSDKEQLIEGTAEVTDGFYNGKVTYTYDGSVPVTGTYVNGIAQVIMTTDPNGKEANVVMISEDGSAWVSQSNINEKRGIYGYY
ncbi:MAG: tetratricopeptide repeat protein, partial [Firmicutes bacterium]|nr:tetratricopeptide repeat protein [Bacillota bacterium]